MLLKERYLAPVYHKINPPVTTIFIRAKGINFFQPRFINWSYLNLGMVHLTHINKNKKKAIFAKNINPPSSAKIFVLRVLLASLKNGISYPPKYKQLINALAANIFIYSLNK